MVAAQRFDEKAFPVHIVTGEFCLKGELHIRGVLDVALNGDDITTVSLFDVQAQALDSDNVAGQFNAPKVVLARRACQFIVFSERPSADDIVVKARLEAVILYTPRFAMRGSMYLGGEQTVTDILGDIKGYFLPVVNVQLFPLFPIRANVPRQAPMILVYRDHAEIIQARTTS